jgi:hypothetical protein
VDDNPRVNPPNAVVTVLGKITRFTIIVPAHRQRKLPASERVRLLLAGENANAEAIGAEQRALGRWARTSTR